MQIANPMYDVVFRYLMRDNKVAKLMINTIIGEKVKSLVFKPKEYSHQTDGIPTVLRMDFAATIQTKNGTTHVLIELQKERASFEVVRFRRYIGEQYYERANQIKQETKQGAIHIQGIPLLPIYILGEKLTRTAIPVLKIQHQYIDVATNEILDFKHPFMECLTHEAIFIQTPYLKGQGRTDLEKLLNIFNQDNMTENKHFLNVNKSDYPEQYQCVLRRLQQAMSDKDVIAQMKREDEFLYIMQLREEELLLTKKVAEAKTKKAEEIAAIEKQRADEKEKLAAIEKQRADEKEKLAAIEKQRADEKEKLIEKMILKMKKIGLSVEEIAQSTTMRSEEVQQIIAKHTDNH